MPIVLVDAARVLTIAGALWLAALVLRLAWVGVRRRAMGDRAGRTHWATHLSYALLLVVSALRRGATLGTPGDWWLVSSMVAVLVGVYGVVAHAWLPGQSERLRRPPPPRGRGRRKR